MGDYHVRFNAGVSSEGLTRNPFHSHTDMCPVRAPPLFLPTVLIPPRELRSNVSFRHSEPFRNQISFAADRDGSAAESVGGQPRLVAFRHVDGCGFCGRVGIPHYTLPDGRQVHLYE